MLFPCLTVVVLSWGSENTETLKAIDSWLFQPSVLEGQMERFMLLLDLKRRCLVNFDSGLALETINQGLPVVPLWSDRIHQRLRENLSSFGQQMS